MKIKNEYKDRLKPAMIYQQPGPIPALWESEQAHKNWDNTKRYKSWSAVSSIFQPFTIGVEMGTYYWYRKVVNTLEHDKRIFDKYENIGTKRTGKWGKVSFEMDESRIHDPQVVLDILDALEASNYKTNVEGTKTHDQLEEYAWTKEVPSDPTPFFDAIKNELDKLGDFETIASEVPVGSVETDKMNFGGIFDLLIKKDGEYILVDFKTGSEVSGDKLTSVYRQMSAYAKMISDNTDIKITRVMVLSAHREKNNYNNIISKNSELKGDNLERMKEAVYKVAYAAIMVEKYEKDAY